MSFIVGFVIFVIVFISILFYIEPRCDHKWEIINKISVDTVGGGRYYKYVLQCSKCGTIKVKTTM